MRILKLTKETQNNILENLLKRSPNSYGEFESRVNDIIQNVREKRDEAIFEYTLKFDGATIDQDNIRVTEEEIKEASQAIRLLGGEREDAISFHLPDSDIFRTLVVIRKTAPTPKKYPRKAGLPAKEPIH